MSEPKTTTDVKMLNITIYEWICPHCGKINRDEELHPSGLMFCTCTYAFTVHKSVEKKAESCPQCNAPLKEKPRGGVACTACDYWFCY